MAPPGEIGILLINTGSPDAPRTRETRAYLRQFLSDPRVIDTTPLARWLLLNLVILPTRPKKSAEAYAKIWTERGSPLISHSEDLRDALQRTMPEATVAIGMAYGAPSLPDALDELLQNGAQRIVLVPMFPQYASATVGAVLELAYRTLAERPNVPPLHVVAPFYEEPEFLDAWAAIAKPQLESADPDHVLLSFHGLPQRHLRQCDPTGTHCLQSPDCCERYRQANPSCYRAHCLATGKGIIERLGLNEGEYTIAFQSKLGREPWLTPAADKTVVSLAQQGTKRLAVLSPAFVADCIETIEELGMQARESFTQHGGQDFTLVTSLNNEPVWVEALAAILRRSLGAPAPA